VPPEKIDLLVMDVDGVLTDGRIIYSESGELIKSFDVTDGTGLKYWHRLGKQSAIISGREPPVVLKRAQELGIAHVFQGVKDKAAVLERLFASLKLEPSRAAYVGDDLMDIPAMRMVGFPVAVATARPEVLAAAEYVTRAEGGRGAVREVVELMLKSQGLWDQIMARYATPGQRS
jgi:3-deoxy-D-manno-octulosonate 8-phosphate phosphatase (KDO 8-P phosphatase)